MTTRSEDAELRAMQAEIERTNTRLHEVATLCATVEQERDAALARLAELEKQEPVIYQAKTKPGFLLTSAYTWEDCEKADFLVYEADGVHVRGLYAAAGASPVEPSQADAQDAARYRWLRSTTNWASNSSNERIDVRNSPELWDAAVDAAIQKELTP